MFGFLLMVSFCKLNFIATHFKFIKTITGKGIFNLFVASMFLIGDRGLWGWIMFLGLCFCGIFFIMVGCACVKGYGYEDVQGEDISPQKASTQLTQKVTKTAVEQAVNNAVNQQAQQQPKPRAAGGAPADPYAVDDRV